MGVVKFSQSAPYNGLGLVRKSELRFVQQLVSNQEYRDGLIWNSDCLSTTAILASAQIDSELRSADALLYAQLRTSSSLATSPLAASRAIYTVSFASLTTSLDSSPLSATDAITGGV